MPYPGSKDGQMPGGDHVPIPDPLIPLAYAAAITTRLKFSTGVIILPQRHPLYLAKQLATLDRLSQGRMMVGIGSGWMKEEFDSLEIDFNAWRAHRRIDPGDARDLERPVASFHGKHFHFHDVKSFPKPVQKAGIPIHVGGHSPAAARRAGKYGDGFFPTVTDPAKLKELFALVREAARKAGRNPDAIEFSAMAAPQGRLAQGAGRGWRDAGGLRPAVVGSRQTARGTRRTPPTKSRRSRPWHSIRP